MSFDWRTHDAETLEQHFNPRVALGQEVALGLIASYTERAEAARQQMTGQYDVRYGDGEKATLDVHPGLGDGPRPVLFFIHGGFWRALDKSDHSFVVPAFVRAGVTVVNVNYDLCPTVTLDTIVAQVRQALGFVWERAFEWNCRRDLITVCGHSAGGHLTGMLLNDPAAKGRIAAAAPLSGVFEPAVVQKISVNADVRLDDAAAARNDCVAQPPVMQVPVLIAAGGDEPDGWREQSRIYAKVCETAGCQVSDVDIPGRNHFTLIDDFADPEGDLHKRMLALIGV
jgi:arylformamidase